MIQLLSSSLSPNTIKSYERTLKSFQEFLWQHGLPLNLPILPISLALYVTSLYNRNFSFSTISSHLSSISYIHKAYELPDPSKSFLVSRALQGARNSSSKLDLRLPITLSLLNKICYSLTTILSSQFDRLLFRSMFLLSFFAFLRVGEITVVGQTNPNTLHLHHVTFLSDGTLQINFSRFKHSHGRSASVLIKPRQVDWCPVSSLKKYIQLRGLHSGFLFIQSNSQPVHRNKFSSILSQSVSFLGLDSSRYLSHSFRIGACTYAIQCGLSDSQIRVLGRWNSDAFRRYIRL